MVPITSIHEVNEVFRVVQTFLITDLDCLRRVGLWKMLWQPPSRIH